MQVGWDVMLVMYVLINHVFYADDLCLMAPCAIALQDYLIFVIAIVLKLI